MSWKERRARVPPGATVASNMPNYLSTTTS